MANIYVRSTDGNDSDNGSTWALAKATIAGAKAIAAAGDTIWLSQSHAEVTNAGVTFDPPSSASTATKVLCGNDGATPPTALATTANVKMTGASNVMLLRGGMYLYGITLEIGQSTEYCALNFSNYFTSYAAFSLERCVVKMAGSGGGLIDLAEYNTYSARIEWVDTDFFCGGNGTRIAVKGADFRWRGGSFLAGGTGPTYLIDGGNQSGGEGGQVLIENVDFSNAPQGMDFFEYVAPYTRATIRNCKLPTGWSGELVNTSGGYNATGIAYRIEMYNCDSGDTNFKLKIQDGDGTIDSETTLVRSGGASDGTTPLAWKMVSAANANWFTRRLQSPEIALWNEVTGASKTVTVEILHDSATALKDDEVWLEVLYSSDASTPKYARAHDGKADILATAADQTTSTVTWTTTGMSNPNKQKLAVTFTPQNKGWFLARVVLAKASKTIYVDPLLTVS